MTQWTIKTDCSDLDKIAIRNTNKFFENTKLKKADIDAFMKLISFRLEDYPSLKADALERIKIKDGFREFYSIHRETDTYLRGQFYMH
jgi:2-hydroxy-3-keto-5-methylthiopentenyl-1-phosphate phosphatase